MRRIYLAVIILLMALPLRAQSTTDAEIRDVITRQLEAFLQDDFVAAFDFASPLIRNQFQTAENFGAMVAQGYPMVHRPQSYSFDALRDVAGGLWQSVIMYDDAGRVYLVEYQMIETEAGWRINGVQVTPLPDAQV